MKRKLKIAYIFLFIGIFGLIVLPQFKLNIGENEFNYPNIDLSSIDSSATLGNFNKGYGLYDSKIYSALVTFEDTVPEDQREGQFKDLMTLVENRIAAAGLHDINIYGTHNDNGYVLNMQFPDYISETDKLAGYLVGKGEISFEPDPQVSTTPVSLKDTDIVGSIKTIYDEQYGNVLTFKFNSSSATNLYFALQNTNNYFLMRVDSTYFAVIQDPNYAKTQSADLQTSVIAVPFADVKLSTNVAMYTNIVKTYFLTAPLTQNVVLNPASVTVKRDFVADHLSYIALLLLASVVLITLLYIIKNNKTKSTKFVLMVSSYLVFTLFILKFVSSTLSVSLLIGYLIGLVIMFYIVGKLLTIEEELQKAFLREILNYGFFVALIIFTLYRFATSASFAFDAFGALLVSVIALMFFSFVNFKFILDTDINPTLKIFKKKS